MPRIISVSRRTDIPAFYGDWFMNRLKEGFAGYVNPFGGQKYILSLKPEDVICFVFWSKNFKPFLEKLGIIEDSGYKFYFNYTITGLPDLFECNLAGKEIAIEALKELGSLYSPNHINWRYDPIIISDSTDYDFHIKNFEALASELEGHVERCIISYVMLYGKVKRNFDRFQRGNGVKIIDPDINFRLKLTSELADIAEKHGIKLLSCCGDYLLSRKVGKAHCIEGALIEELFSAGFQHYEKPTRRECGCTYSVDIGAYDTCPHGCIYCYANMNKDIAEARFRGHDKNPAFLGYTKAESDEWIEEVKKREKSAGFSSTLFDFV
ncbi:Uncharacterised protein [uncultured archaeon]|nr:Uncharacterised protein [uncultured archaeon]